MSTEITVHGAANALEPPERGVVHATVSYEGPDMDRVYESVAKDTDTVKRSVDSLRTGDDGPVSRWSARNIRTWATRPWNQDGVQLPVVNHAKVDIEVEFRDFSALSRWLAAQIDGIGGFDVSYVNWVLTPERRRDLLREVRTEAVKDAASRAQQYADALELGEVRPVAVADAGMLSPGLQRGDHPMGLAARAMSVGSAPSEIEFEPEDIEVSATVDARFVAG
jgi:uncharacterized protein YggE